MLMPEAALKHMPDVILIARCPVPDCPERGKPHEQIVSRATLYQMFDPDGSDRIFFRWITAFVKQT